MDVIYSKARPSKVEPLFPRLLSFKNHDSSPKLLDTHFGRQIPPHLKYLKFYHSNPKYMDRKVIKSLINPPPLQSASKKRHLCCHLLRISHSILPLQLQSLLWCFHHTWHTARGTNHSLHVVLCTLKFCNDGLQNSLVSHHWFLAQNYHFKKAK